MRISTGAPTPDEAGAISRFLGGALGAKIFFSIVFVVIAALGGALFLTKRGADRAADESVNKALAATQSAIQDALGSRAQSLLQVTIPLPHRGRTARTLPAVGLARASGRGIATTRPGHGNRNTRVRTAT